MLLVHPDLFAAHPELAAANDAALKALGGLLADARSGARSADEMTPPRAETLTLYARTSAPGEFVRVAARLRLPGGHCPDVLGAQLGALFADCGLPSTFHWGDEYWKSTYTMSSEAVEEWEAEVAAAAREECEPGAAGGGRRAAAGSSGDGKGSAGRQS